MMTNLFSVFDPSSSIISAAWLIVIFSFIIYSTKMWVITQPMQKALAKINFIFKKEVKFSLGKAEKSTENMIMTAFFSVVMLNFVALFPQIFSSTSHLTITLPLSLTFWLALMMFGWAKNTSHMLSHLVPQGTPGALMMFMVLVEMTSNIIRPITLCVRLTANMIAGHLLMTLLGNFIMTMSFSTAILVTISCLALAILESAVACIQAYVFMTLITLYTTELSYW